MAMSSHILVIQSGKCKFARIADDHLILDYFSVGNIIKKPTSARLITVDGLKKSILVYTDFTEAQIVNGKQDRYLGISTPMFMPAVNTYIPIIGSQLPAFGYISLCYSDGKSKFTQIHTGVTVVIEIVDENGASYDSRV